VIERTDDGEVAVLTLAHGPVNAMDTALCEAVADAFDALAGDPARAVVLTGSGRAFSAGVDLRGFLAGGPDWVAGFLPSLSRMFRAVFTLPKPVVAALNGHAIAGGCVLACCADTVLQAGGRIGVPELAVGVPFPVVPLEVMRYAVGDAVARRLMLSARLVEGAEAVALGLVDRVVEPGALVAEAVAAARTLAGITPPDTFAQTKTQLRREAVALMDAHAAAEDARAVELWSARATDGWTARYLEAATGRART
jgi:enoyl-CoA hydratase/carnithine racemase